MSFDQIVSLAQAGGLVLMVVALLTGQVWARPGVEFIQKQLTGAEERERAALDRSDLALAVTRENTEAMKLVLAELRGRVT